MNYFWLYTPATTPRPTVNPRDRQPSERLCASCTQSGLPAHKQKALVQPWVVDTLAPVGALTSLRYHSLANLRAVDRTLTPIYPLQNLETLITAQWWDASELAELRRRNLHLKP